MNDDIKELLKYYNKAIVDCIHHNFLIESMNSKLSKEFFVLFRSICDKIDTTDSTELKKLYKSVLFLRNIESFAIITKKIIFATSSLDQPTLDEYKNKIINFYRVINYPIDLDNFVYDYNDDFEFEITEKK